MNRVLLLFAIMAAVGRADSAPLREFYIVAATTKDNVRGGDDTLIHVWQDGADTVVRYVGIEYVYPYNPRPLVQAVDTIVHRTSPAKLANGSNPCAVKQGAFDAAVKKFAGTSLAAFESTAFGVVAQCGSQSVVLRLSSDLPVNLKGIDRLWKLNREIIRAAFGSWNMFHDSSGKNNLSHQAEGEKLVPELRSGRYDAGLAAARKAGTGKLEDSSFRYLLEHYRGPVSAEDAEARPVARLVDVEAYRFTQFVAPRYPALAMQARVQGKVKLRLTVDPATGEVRGASAVSGHPLLCPSAEEAAKQWRLEPGSVSAGTVEVTLEYALWD